MKYISQVSLGLLITLFYPSAVTFSQEAQIDATDFTGLTINELLPNPSGIDSGSEFIELYNNSAETISLTGLSIRDKSGKSTYTFAEQEQIASQSYITLYNKADFKFALNNTSDEVTLFTDTGEIISSLGYDTTTENTSWNASVQTYEAEPTPNEPNEISRDEDTAATEETDSLENIDLPELTQDTDLDQTQNEDDQLTILQNLPPITLNEIYANPLGSDDSGEFIELFNPTDSDANLSAWQLRDASNTGSFTFAQGSTIPTQDFLTVFRSTSKIALNNSGEETVSLVSPTGDVVSTTTLNNAKEGVSWAWENNTWQETYAITPNSANFITPPLQCPVAQNTEQILTETLDTNKQNLPDIALSEIFPNPPGSDNLGEFIELYNPSNQVIDLKDWTLRDSSANGKYKLNSAVTIAPQSYLVITREQFKFALNNTTSELVTLEKPDGTISSSVSYDAIEENISYSRVDDKWTKTASITPSQKNIFTDPDINTPIKNDNTVSPPKTQENQNQQPLGPFLKLQLSEALPNPQSGDQEFIEIYNPHNQDVSLFGYTLSDASKNGSYTFEDSQFIPAKAYKVFSKEQTKIALNNTGNETITLKNPEGITDSSVTFISIAKGKSFALLNGTWQATTTVTPNAPNILTNSSAGEAIQQKESAVTQLSDQTKAVPVGPFASLLLSEVFPNPTGTDALNEFVEIYNPNKESVNLDQWILRDASTSGKFIIDDLVIQGESYGIIYRAQSGLALNNTGDETVSLLSPDEKVVASFAYNDAKEGVSYNFNENQWQKSSTPTPGTPNVIKSADTPQQTKSESSTPSRDEITDFIINDTYPEILITEILPNPKGNENTGEFIELYNPTNTEVSLAGWVLKDTSKNGSYIFTNQVIPANSYLTLYRDQFKFALNNTGEETLTLVTPNKSKSDTISYNKTIEGVSLGKKAPQKNTSLFPTTKPTPGSKNIFDLDSMQDTDSPAQTTKNFPKIFLSELLPAPNAGDQEFIEIYNPQAEAVSLQGWTLRDNSRNGKYTFDNDTIIDPGEYIVITRDRYKFALNNSGGESITLYDPAGIISSTVSYEKATKNTSYGWTGDDKNESWRFSTEKTPGNENVFGQELQIVDIDIKNAYKDVKAEFEAEISGATDARFRWDFGDGNKSTKQSATHTYKKSGTYEVSVEVTSSIESKKETLRIKVKKYPKRKIRITQIYPNPPGKDTGKESDNEYIVITNKDDKSISLKDWSIATGKDTDSLRNHPFKKTIKLKKGQSKQIIKKHSAISLNNSEGVIELRAPDGNVIDDTSYSYTQAKTIPEGALYTKDDGLWSWSLPTSSQKISKQMPILQGLSEQEQQEIIAAAMKNMQLKDSQQQNKARKDADQTSNITTTEKTETLWEIFKRKLREIFSKNNGREDQSNQSFNGSLHEISQNYPKEICQTNPSVEKIALFDAHCTKTNDLLK